MLYHRAVHPFAYVLAALLLLSPIVGATADESRVDVLIEAHLDALRVDLDPRVISALARIDGLDRRVLAARSYLRGTSAIADRWSWSQARIDQYAGSALQQALDAEIAQVRERFESENPGYTLWVNPQVRSVELQIERWNENETVGRAAQSMLAEVRAAASEANVPAAGTDRGREWFARTLRDATPTPSAPLAAPGLSRHGRMQAVDFHVRQGDVTIAGPEQAQIATVWHAQGWCERLVRAVRLASDRFEGPLVEPEEPWHYEYRAQQGTVAFIAE
jgi:hypothetical protein